jgi:hypothetical protein
VFHTLGEIGISPSLAVPLMMVVVMVQSPMRTDSGGHSGDAVEGIGGQPEQSSGTAVGLIGHPGQSSGPVVGIIGHPGQSSGTVDGIIGHPGQSSGTVVGIGASDGTLSMDGTKGHSGHSVDANVVGLNVTENALVG